MICFAFTPPGEMHDVVTLFPQEAKLNTRKKSTSNIGVMAKTRACDTMMGPTIIILWRLIYFFKKSNKRR